MLKLKTNNPTTNNNKMRVVHFSKIEDENSPTLKVESTEQCPYSLRYCKQSHIKNFKQ
jgi:hypothetical protein